MVDVPLGESPSASAAPRDDAPASTPAGAPAGSDASEPGLKAPRRARLPLFGLPSRLAMRLRAPGIARRPNGSFRVVASSLCIGLAAGAMVVLVKALVVAVQTLTLGFAIEDRIPDLTAWDALRVGLALAAGGLVIAGVTAVAEGADRRRGRAAPIDAVEANALRGGLLGPRDGISVVGPILTSVGTGASVGIEAAVTQVGAVLASQLGQRQRFARSEIRLLVGSGVAASIGAAYGAPVAGMLYAFELVLGEYTTSMLAPVGLAAVAGAALAHALQGGGPAFEILAVGPVTGLDYPLAALIGGLCALLGIATMVLASGAERLLRRAIPVTAARFAVGAVLLGGLSLGYPGVLGSGHASIGSTVGGQLAGLAACGLLLAKILASAVSLGVGYRGGLFSAALLIGALAGQVVAGAAALVPGLPPVQPALCAAIGMAALGASIIGSPLAMIFLVLETSGNIAVVAVVAVGAAVASFLTGRLFGYSFATWRFQQRGLALEGGRDVSRLSAVPIRPLIRPPKRSLDAQAGIDAVVRAVSAAGGRGTAVLAPDGRFVGLIDPALVEIADGDRALPVVAADLVYARASAVTDAAALSDALDIFRTDDRATIAVVDAAGTGRLVGCIRARDAFAAASQRAEATRRADLGVA